MTSTWTDLNLVNLICPELSQPNRFAGLKSFTKLVVLNFLQKLHGISTEPLGFLMGDKKLISLFKMLILFNWLF